MAVDDSAVPSHHCCVRDQLLCAVSLSGPVKFATGWVARCPRLSQSTQRASELWLTERVVCVLHLQPWKKRDGMVTEQPEGCLPVKRACRLVERHHNLNPQYPWH